MQPAGSKRNILLISLDDAVAFWHFKTVFGQALQTPNLDRICAESSAFHAAYCQAPVCSPSRASFMSGKAPHQIGVTGPDNRYFDRIPAKVMWPYLLKENGFFCSSGGKVMRGYQPLPDAVHSTIFSDDMKKFRLSRRKRVLDKLGDKAGVKWMEYGGFRDGLANANPRDDRKHYDHQVANSAIAFLNDYDGEAPFYREVGLAGTHGPWATPRRFKEMYRDSGFRKPADWQNGFDDCPVMDVDAPKNLDASKAWFWKKSVRNYFSGMSHSDYHLGRIWDALKASRHADNTLVVIVSDHGFHMGERNRFRKHTLWEQVANVPLIVHDPARPKEQVVTDPVGLIDLGPTVMDYLDLPQIKGSPGRSLRPQIEGASVPNRAVPTFFHDNSAIRKENYRFIRYRDGSTQFFDLSKDWWQTSDLGPGHPDYDRIRTSHAACCKAHGFDTPADAFAQEAV